MADGGVEYHNAEMANDREPGHGRQVEVRRGRTYLAFQGLPHRIILFQEEKNKKRACVSSHGLIIGRETAT